MTGVADDICERWAKPRLRHIYPPPSLKVSLGSGMELRNRGPVHRSSVIRDSSATAQLLAYFGADLDEGVVLGLPPSSESAHRVTTAPPARVVNRAHPTAEQTSYPFLRRLSQHPEEQRGEPRREQRIGERQRNAILTRVSAMGLAAMVVCLTLTEVNAYEFDISRVSLSASAMESNRSVQPGEPVTIYFEVTRSGTAENEENLEFEVWFSEEMAPCDLGADSCSSEEWKRVRTITRPVASVNPNVERFVSQQYAPHSAGTYFFAACYKATRVQQGFRWQYDEVLHSGCGNDEDQGVQLTVANATGGFNLTVGSVEGKFSTDSYDIDEYTSNGFWQTNYIARMTDIRATVRNAGTETSPSTVVTLYRHSLTLSGNSDITSIWTDDPHSTIVGQPQSIPAIPGSGSSVVTFQDVQIPATAGDYYFYVRVNPSAGETYVGDNHSAYSATALPNYPLYQCFFCNTNPRLSHPKLQSVTSVESPFVSRLGIALLTIHDEVPDIAVTPVYVNEPGRLFDYVLVDECFELRFRFTNVGRREHLFGMGRGVVISTNRNSDNFARSYFGASSNCYSGSGVTPETSGHSASLSPGESTDVTVYSKIGPSTGLRGHTRSGTYKYAARWVGEEVTSNDSANDLSEFLILHIVDEYPDLAVASFSIAGQSESPVRVSRGIPVTLTGTVTNKATSAAPTLQEMQISLTGPTGVVVQFVDSSVPRSGRAKTVSFTALTPTTVGQTVWNICARTIFIKESVANTGDNCQPFIVQVIGPENVPPSAPAYFSAMGSRQRIVLQWYPPLLTGGSDILSYTIETSTVGSEEWSELRRVGAHRTQGEYEFIHRGLADGQTVLYRIAANNATHEGQYSHTTRSVTDTAYTADLVADINRDGVVSLTDAEVFYFGFVFHDRLGNGVTGGQPRHREEHLHSKLADGLLRPDDDDYKDLLRRVHRDQRVDSQLALDLNGSGAVDAHDAAIMYFAFGFPELVGDGSKGGFERYRRVFIASHYFPWTRNPSDSSLMALIRRANELRTLRQN